MVLLRFSIAQRPEEPQFVRPRFFSLPSAQLANEAWLARGDGSSGPRLAIIGVGMMGRELPRVGLLLGRMRIQGVYEVHAESQD